MELSEAFFVLDAHLQSLEKQAADSLAPAIAAIALYVQTANFKFQTFKEQLDQHATTVLEQKKTIEQLTAKK
jgi:hypothetical protein